MRHRGAATEIEEIHQYIYAGGKLLRETISDGTTTKTLDFNYDNVGMPYSLIYNNGTTTTTYYYVTNLQGDVMHLVDASGNEAAAYDYDPYGKVITATGAMAEINPLRYRGYYYDSETGFYYLQSRYYDPEICRFINADNYAGTGQGIIGYNMFAYCLNNPILCADENGNAANPRYGISLICDGNPNYGVFGDISAYQELRMHQETGVYGFEKATTPDKLTSSFYSKYEIDISYPWYERLLKNPVISFVVSAGVSFALSLLFNKFAIPIEFVLSSAPAVHDYYYHGGRYDINPEKYTVFQRIDVIHVYRYDVGGAVYKSTAVSITKWFCQPNTDKIYHCINSVTEYDDIIKWE